MRSKPSQRPPVESSARPARDEWNDAPRAPAPRRGRRIWYFFMFLAFLAALIFFAPNIISQTALKDVAIERFTRDYPMHLKVDKLHLSWLSPVSVGDISLADERGEPLLEVSAIRSEKTLLSLVSDWKHLGRFQVIHPVANVELTESGSNWESFIASLPKSDSTEPAAKVDVAVNVEDGLIRVQDTLNRRQWELGRIRASATAPVLSAQPIGAKLECVLTVDQQPAGSIRGEVELEPDPTDADNLLQKGAVTLQTDGMPLEIAELGLRRVIPHLTLGGDATCDVRYEWSDSFASQKASIGKLEVAQAEFRAPQWLGSDVVQSRRLTGAGNVSIDGGQLTFSKLVLDADAAHAEADGVLAWGALFPSSGREPSAADWQKWLSQNVTIQGEVDLAQVSRMLPATLHLKENTQLAKGVLQASFRSSDDQGQRRWVAAAQTSELEGTAGGKAIRWDQPIQLALTAKQSDSGIHVESLTCDSSFMNVKASGELEKGTLTANANLDQFLDELGQFVELGGIQLAGQLKADLNWQRDRGDLLVAEGNATVEKFQLAAGNLLPWREDKLVVATKLAGEASLAGIRKIQDAELLVESGKDRLQVKLIAPVTNVPVANISVQNILASGDWNVFGQLVGDLGTWLPRLQPIVALPGWDLRGTVDAKVTAALSGADVQLPEIKVQLTQLKATGPGLNLNEPRVQVDAAASWSQNRQELDAKALTIASSALALRAENVQLQLRDGLQMAGDAGFRADLARLSNWFTDPRQPPSTRVTGMATGQLRMNHAGGVSQASLVGDVADLIVATRSAADPMNRRAVTDSGWKTAWEESNLKLSGLVKYDAPKEQIQLSKFDINSKAVNVNATGTVSDLSGQCDVDLTGQFAYDWKNVGAILRPYTGELLWIEGEEDRNFVVRGPLFVASSDRRGESTSALRVASTKASATGPLVPDDLMAASKIGWKSANYSGFAIGQGELDARLERGVLNLGPLDVQLSGGAFHFEPQVTLNDNPIMITAQPGVIADHVQITPEMCQSWLKFLAPILADATLAQGKFSIQLDEAQLPATNPVAGTVRGRLTIHNARIGPGPMSREMLWLAAQVKNLTQKRPLDPNLQVSEEWVDVPEQSIPFEVTQGRVVNKGIAFHVKDVDIRSHGSVGFDQTISLTAEVPVKDEWVANQRYLSALRGQSLQIPIGGTVSKPKLDSRALADVSKQAITGAASRLLEDELNKGLDRLLRPKK